MSFSYHWSSRKEWGGSLLLDLTLSEIHFELKKCEFALVKDTNEFYSCRFEGHYLCAGASWLSRACTAMQPSLSCLLLPILKLGFPGQSLPLVPGLSFSACSTLSTATQHNGAFQHPIFSFHKLGSISLLFSPSIQDHPSENFETWIFWLLLSPDFHTIRYNLPCPLGCLTGIV